LTRVAQERATLSTGLQPASSQPRPTNEDAMDDASTRINLAVDQCLDRCSKASTPPAITVDSFCQELLDSGWNAKDVKLVSSNASRVLIQRAMGN